MRFAVESWAPEYGSAIGEPADPQHGSLADSAVAVRTDAEVPDDHWGPRDSTATPGEVVRFVDGVRRIDARVWITGDDGQVHQGLAASYAAGVVRCDGVARIESCTVRRNLFSAAPSLAAVATRNGDYQPCAVTGEGVDELSLRLQRRMGELEARVASEAGIESLLIVDGPLGGVPLGGVSGLDSAVGYVKTHRRTYLPAELSGVVGELAPGQRTPLFLTTTGWSRWSWYLRLPSGAPSQAPAAHAWSGVVRCEASGDLETRAAVALADISAATLPRYASTPQKDPRAPQNLVPVGELERVLRHALGDPRVLERGLRLAAGP